MTKGLSDDEIMRVVREIAASPLPPDARRVRYAGFAEAYPLLFDKACMGPVDEGMLRMMLRMRKRVEDDKISEDDANAAVGIVLAKKYVEPTLKALPVPAAAAAAAADEGAGGSVNSKRPRTD